MSKIFIGIIILFIAVVLLKSIAIKILLFAIGLLALVFKIKYMLIGAAILFVIVLICRK